MQLADNLEVGSEVWSIGEMISEIKCEGSYENDAYDDDG